MGIFKTLLLICGSLFWLASIFLWRHYNSGLGPGIRSKVGALRSLIVFVILFLTSVVLLILSKPPKLSGIELSALGNEIRVFTIDHILTILNGLFLALTIFFYFADRKRKNV